MHELKAVPIKKVETAEEFWDFIWKSDENASDQMLTHMYMKGQAFGQFCKCDKIYYQKKTYPGYRLAYIFHYGPITPGMALWPVCGKHSCCNPLHRIPVTAYEFSSMLARQRHHERRSKEPKNLVEVKRGLFGVIIRPKPGLL